MNSNKIEVFICPKCNYEDSSFIPMKKNKPSCVCPKCKATVPMNILELERGKCLSIQEYLELVEFIAKEHSFTSLKGKMIKYISHTIDFRTSEIFEIKLDDKHFSRTNENRHKDLQNWIYEYLNE